MNHNITSEDEFSEFHIAQIESYAAKFAKAKADRTYLENYRKALRAKLALEYAQQGIKSHQAQVLKAEADDKYLEVLKALHTATQIETQCYWELEKLKMQFEKWRTTRADYRATMNMR